MSDGPVSTETPIQQKSIIPEVPYTDEVYKLPVFVDSMESGIRVIDAGYVVTPNESPVSNTPIINALIDYLNRPFIVDDFTDHREERTPWIKKQPDETQEWLVLNRVGVNAINRIFSFLTTYLWLINEEGVDMDLGIDKKTMTEMQKIMDIYRQNRNITKKYEVNAGDLKQYQEDIKDKSKKVVVVADDPSQSYDNLVLDEKEDLVGRLTAVSITFLQQNGFTVEKRPFNQPDLS